VILCTCLSPAVDLTYRIDGFEVGVTNRVSEVVARPGGKAVNVARILHALGQPVEVLLPLGGAAGEDVARVLATLGLVSTVVASGVPTRRTVTVADGATGAATVIVEPAVIDCWPELFSTFSASVSAADVIVISGVVPIGAPIDAMSTMVALARAAGVPVVVDTSGAALVDALLAGPTMVKPNADELALLSQEREPVAAARTLAETYGTSVVASLGVDGIVAATTGNAWIATPAAVLEGNPTGAGDAVVAGLARALRADSKAAHMDEILRDCVALGAAAVLRPAAGEVDLDAYAAQRQGVVVRELGGVAS
jgi:tagatose 6-phosphate kinase